MKKKTNPFRAASSVLVLPFSRLRLKDVPSVGGKNASLGEMFRKLKTKKIPVPDGFSVTTAAYWALIDQAKLRPFIKQTLRGLDKEDTADVARRGELIRGAILKAEMPMKVRKAVVKAYADLSRRLHVPMADVAVRSSATAEDLPSASFAGQQDSYLHIQGDDNLILAVQKCMASLFNDRAIVYRENNRFDHLKVALSVGVQQMVRSDIGSAGVMFTLHTETGFQDAVLVNAAYGLGESVVQGIVNPDQFLVHKPTLALGFKSVIEHRLGNKLTKIIYRGGTTEQVKVPDDARKKWVLDDAEVLQLAKWGVEIEKYFSHEAKHHKPMDIEWAKDGKTGKLYIVQARPETVASSKDKNVLITYRLKASAKPILSGVAVGQKIGAGKVRNLKSAKEMASFKPGEVLVAHMTDPDWVPVMQQAAAIVTEAGGRTCHAAIVSRELGVPCVVGVEGATKVLKDGMPVTVSAENGEEGFIYHGILPYDIKTQELKRPKRLRTKVMLNIGNPDTALEYSSLPVDGVGLARMEFILNQHVKVHPLATLNPSKLSATEKAQMNKLSTGYPDAREYFVSVLSEGMAKIAAAFYPKPVIVRTSDFKTNEYANLLGGKHFEPLESNPMIGWRGASRYYDPKYSPAFALECEAIRRVREKMGLKNMVVMIPFCRTVQEAKDVQAEMRKNGLVRGKNGLELYMMVEIPSNVILAEEFANYFDGFSIGSNDLTQLTLGVDRDSALVRHLYDERNQAVKTLVASVIRSAKKTRTKIGICGQAPSDYPEFAAFLVKEGIDSMSLNPDSVMGIMKKLKR
ncbi:MAG: phosphoenolpyruvate synthase [Patescibacteria group bacterium]